MKPVEMTAPRPVGIGEGRGDRTTADGAKNNTSSTGTAIPADKVLRDWSPPWREATLIDVFAAHALTLMASPTDYPDPERVAERAYAVAVAMCDERADVLEKLKQQLVGKGGPI